ncbi:MAG: hypothetical protein C4525_06420 [Desulfarculus sp.]|nr:MAG: hypothetical protein C4525_06420 [Desulfarculus sp.]
MDLNRIINQARDLAQRFQAAGRNEVRLPVFAYEDWRSIYNQPHTGQSLAEHHAQTKQNWYLMHFLRCMGVTVHPVPVAAGAFSQWARAGGRDLADPHELAHAVGHYANDPSTPPANCRHGSLNPAYDGLGGLVTITVLGESEEQPEVMTVVQHSREGQVLQSLQLPAVDFSPQEAWQQAQQFLERIKPSQVFHDQQVRRPSYCPECNGLMVSVASPQEAERAR